MKLGVPKNKITIRYGRTAASLLSVSIASLAISACDMMPKSAKQSEPVVTETSPEQIPSGNGNRNIAANDLGATPMVERVAVIGLLNKRTGKSRDIKINPDQSIRFGNVVVKVQACERTAPWETYPDIGAFTQLFVKERPPGTNQSVRWRKIFSGWLHKNNPVQNVVEHALYDVWVKDCIMLFPGETEPPFNDTSAPTDPDLSETDKRPSNAPQIPTRRTEIAGSQSDGTETAESGSRRPEVNEPATEISEPLPTEPLPPVSKPEPTPEPEEPSEQSLEDLVDSAVDG